jgi:hypothetical protein
MTFLRRLARAGALSLLAAGAATAQIDGHPGGIGQPDRPAPPAPPAAPGTPPAAQPGVDPLMRELVRKATAREAENNFCARVGWPPGNSTSYVAWLEAATVGATKANTFKNGADCQFDRVTQVFTQNGARCVRYDWYACQRGGSCTTGSALACKPPGGNWEHKE